MDWGRLVIGGRVTVRLPSGGDAEPAEVTGQLLGRDHSKFVELGELVRDRDPDDFRAVVRLDDGTILLAPLRSVVGRAE